MAATKKQFSKALVVEVAERLEALNHAFGVRLSPLLAKGVVANFALATEAAAN